MKDKFCDSGSSVSLSQEQSTQDRVILKYEEKLQKLQEKLDSANSIIAKTAKRYMPADVVDLLLGNEGSIIKSSTVNAAILFCDLRDFTMISEKMPAEDLIKMLNVWTISMGDMIEAHNGMIIDYIGDSIFAVFGVLKNEDTARHDAVAAALAMQEEMISINELGELMGHPYLEMGIGIHYGKAMAGSIGSRTRLKYDIIGKNVNLASRIQSYTVGNQILVSSAIAEVLEGELHVGKSKLIAAKGVAQPVAIYEVLGLGEQMLVREEECFISLSSPLIISLRLLTEKDVGNEGYTAELLEYSGHELIIRVPIEIPLDANVFLSRADGGECYGKVIEQTESGKIKVYATKESIAALLGKNIQNESE